ncbi:MAG: hypothetical protein AUF74_01065 [Thaumarchaeota archaeon 13_1_20CM_2_38_5]|nr:MAG: hypothetical protein AUF74_01065 [Thaumarchaeota archaeon 13_1_20CM_2_38_5]
MWKLELEEYYFKIYDEHKNIVGYFAPEYGEIYPEEKADEVIKEMHKRQEKIKSGYLALPFVKFGIFEEGKEMNLDYLVEKLADVNNRISLWKSLFVDKDIRQHKITVSHTDHDMLSVTLELVFTLPVSLEKNQLQNEISKILDLIHQEGLL